MTLNLPSSKPTKKKLMLLGIYTIIQIIIIIVLLISPVKSDITLETLCEFTVKMFVCILIYIQAVLIYDIYTNIMNEHYRHMNLPHEFNTAELWQLKLKIEELEYRLDEQEKRRY